jgi:hypothetical protein
VTKQTKRNKRHPQARLELRSGEIIQVDSGLTQLVFEMNNQGLYTFNSCEDNDGYGYVHFGGDSAKPFMHVLLREWLNAKGKKPLDGITFENHDNKTWPGSFAIRWNPYDFKRLLRYVRTAMREIGS